MHQKTLTAITLIAALLLPAFASAAHKNKHHGIKNKRPGIKKKNPNVEVCIGVGTTITVAKAKIRDSNDTDKVVGFIKQGAVVFVTADKVDGRWYPVRTQAGKEGLVAAWMLEPRACVQEYRPIKATDTGK
jgi:Bacterial SH3 domain